MPVLSTLGAAIANVYGLASGLIKDQYFNLVSLLLPGNGTNGAQNNTFLDGSGNTFTITRNGNTTQGTFSPFSQTGWGAYFDGSNDSVSVVSDASWALSGVFSVEAWVWNGGTQTNYPGIFATPTNGFVLAFKTDTSQFGVAQSGVAWTSVLATPPTTNTWTHVAVTRDSSNVMRMFYNGVLKASATVTTSFAQGALTIGAQSGSGSLLGYLSNARWIKGSIPTSYQTSSTTIDASIFTPSTSSLTTSSQGATSGDVKLLALQNNRFIDNSSSPFTLTPNNGVAITPFSPFAPTQAYLAAAVGGSGYFDGTGDSLSLPTNASFAMGTGDFTIEFWLYTSNVATNGYVIQTDTVAATNSLFISFGSSALRLTNGGTVFATTPTLVVNTWYHIAVVRSGTSSVIYTNGVAGTAVTCTADFTQNTGGIGLANYIGYLSNLRFVKGVAVYTGNFTPPTGQLATSGSASAASYPSTTNVNTSFASSACSLLLNFTNAGVVDATAKNVLETVGNAQISTTQSKWGGGSMYFDGTGDYLKCPDVPMLNLQSSDFTIEAWIYITTTPSGAQVIYSRETAAYSGILFLINASLNVGANLSSDGTTYQLILTGGTLSLNAWNYVCLVRSGSGTNNIKLYIAGSQVAQGTFASAIYSPSGVIPVVGARNTNGDLPFSGYIDDLRITRYARTITASPTAPFPVQ